MASIERFGPGSVEIIPESEMRLNKHTSFDELKPLFISTHLMIFIGDMEMEALWLSANALIDDHFLVVPVLQQLSKLLSRL